MMYVVCPECMEIWQRPEPSEDGHCMRCGSSRIDRYRHCMDCSAAKRMRRYYVLALERYWARKGMPLPVTKMQSDKPSFFTLTSYNTRGADPGVGNAQRPGPAAPRKKLQEPGRVTNPRVGRRR